MRSCLHARAEADLPSSDLNIQLLLSSIHVIRKEFQPIFPIFRFV
jgi:hypothetical protein